MRYYFRRSGNMVDDCLKSRLGNKMVCKTLVRKCPPVTKKCPLAKPRCSNPVCVDGKWVCKPTTITTTTTPARKYCPQVTRLLGGRKPLPPTSRWKKCEQE